MPSAGRQLWRRLHLNCDQGYSTRGVTCWSGNDDEAHAARHQYGAGGVISVTSNIIPGLFSSLMAARDDQQMDRCISCNCKAVRTGSNLCRYRWLL